MQFEKRKELLAVSRDAKTKKGEKYGWLTGILYLAPNTLSGFQVCPKATKGCIEVCLNISGRGYHYNVQESRKNKTRWFFLDRESFMKTLVNDITKLEKRARNKHFKCAVRLNGTSDIPWEKIACVKNDKKYASVMEAFPKIQFYDYTKIIGRKKAIELPNYHLTFSLSENNDKEAIWALQQGYNVSVVFNINDKEPMPTKWNTYNVVDGTTHDVRLLDNETYSEPVIVGLRPKGKAAKNNGNGFVRNVDSLLAC